jgi:PEP-CTERM motif
MTFRDNLSRVAKTMASAALLASAVWVGTGLAGATALTYTGTGVLNTGGLLAVQVFGNTTTFTPPPCINFYNGATPDACDATPNTFTLGAPLDASLFTFGGAGTIKDIPLGVAPIAQFVTAAGPQGTINFDLTALLNGTSPACTLGVTTCSVGPFNFTSNANGTTVTLDADLCGYTGTIGTGCTPYVALFTSQFPGQTIAQVIAASQTGTGVSDSVSGTLTPTPEPGTTMLLGSGLMAMVFVVRRFRA